MRPSSASIRLTMSFSTAASRLSAGRRAADDLYRSADSRQGVLDLVRNHRCHLTDLRERRAFAEPLFEMNTARQVVKDAGELSLPFNRDFAN